MQSKTSCFNKTIFRKHVTRFWPVWAAYFAVWLLDMPIAMLSQREYLRQFPAQVQSGALQAVNSGVVISFIFAVLMAMAVWSFLYNSRSASGAACLPVTRTGQYLSGMLAGLLPLAAVHVVIFLLTALAEASIGVVHLPSLLTWLCATLLILLFFYGFATLCAMLTGNIIVLPAVYVVLNLVGAGLQVLLNGIVDFFVYGLNGFDALWLIWLSPVVKMLESGMVQPDQAYDEVRQAWFTTGWHFEGWFLVILYAAVGVVMLLGAWALLRRRKMETAGDVVAVPVLKPVFRWCMGVCAGLCFADMMLYVFTITGETQAQVFAVTAVWLIVGAFLGWFIAEMLIRRSFRVFRGGWRGFGGWALCCVVLLGCLTALELDVFGYERRQPKPEQIEGVSIFADGESAYLTEPASIEQALALHRDVIENKARQDQCNNKAFFLRDPYWQSRETELQTVSFSVTYGLKNGGSLSRMYQLPYVAGETDSAAYAAQALLNSPEAVQNRKETPFEFTSENVSYGSVSAVMPAKECAAAAGYDDVEDYVLIELGGHSPAEAAALPETERRAALRDILADWRYIDGMYDKRNAYMYRDGEYTYIGDSALPEIGGEPDWDHIWLNYTMELTSRETWELYSACVLPDVAANGLGRVWILTDDDYAATVYAAGVEINARWPDDDSGLEGVTLATMPEDYPAATREDSVRYYTFSTVPTVDSARTNAFFEAHGLHLRTVAEARAAAR